MCLWFNFCPYEKNANCMLSRGNRNTGITAHNTLSYFHMHLAVRLQFDNDTMPHCLKLGGGAAKEDLPGDITEVYKHFPPGSVKKLSS